MGKFFFWKMGGGGGGWWGFANSFSLEVRGEGAGSGKKCNA